MSEDGNEDGASSGANSGSHWPWIWKVQLALALLMETKSDIISTVEGRGSH